MVSVIIHDNGESSVVKYTYECLYKELKDIHGSELLIAKDWFEALPKIRNNYVCLVESDCLVSPGFFQKQVDALMKNQLRRISMVSPVAAVNHWDNTFYGYQVSGQYADLIEPITKKRSNALHPIQIGYLPGAIIRVKMLRQAIEDLGANMSWKNDLVFLSTELSFAFWQQGQGGAKGQNGNPVYINPAVTYVTTEDYVNNVAHFGGEIMDLMSKFNKESI